MLNKSGVTKTSMANVAQILMNVEHQVSVGCIVKSNEGVAVGSRNIMKAGTPLKIDLANLQTPAEKADGSSNAMNAVLLHDVDVTGANANGTALIFGFVNLNRIDETTQSLITTAQGNAAGVTPLITFVKA